MPKITDDDDVNLDDIETDPPDDTSETDDAGDDQPEGDNVDDSDPEGDEPGDGEEGADEIAAGSERQQERQETRRGGRENARVRSLNEDLRRERTEREALQRRFDEFAQRQQQPAQVQETVDQRNARRALMSDSERASEDIAASEQRITRMVNHTTLTVQDSADKSIFEAKAVNDPLYRRWAPKVEAERQRLAAQGSYVARDAIMAYLVGKAAIDSRGSKQNKTAQALGRRRVERQTTRPKDTRNDAVQNRRGTTRSLEDRLANIPL